MAKSQSVISLDPVDRKKAQQGVIGKLLISRWYGGDSVIKTEKFGHYMFCGKQRKGKTSSAIWYAERLAKRYKKVRIHYYDDEKMKLRKFKEVPKVKLWSNFGPGKYVNKANIFKLIDEFDPYANEVRIILIDEFHTYFPKDSTSSADKKVLNELTNVFSQLAKRNCYVLSTAQVYGRLDKRLREQCLYMVDCSVNYRGRLVNDFIEEEEIVCDDLGRWAGIIESRKIHGLSELEYDTKRLIRE